MKAIPVFLLLLCSSVALAKELKDATGTLVQVPEHPARIVALAPSVAELAAGFLGADLQRIIAVSENTDYPPALKNVESIGPYTRVNLEKVTALKPDLVLATVQGNSKDQVLHLRELGVPVFVLGTANLQEIEAAMKTTADLLGESAKGSIAVARFEKSLAELRRRGRSRSPKKRVLIQLDDTPLVVAGGGSFLTEALRTVGAENAYGDSREAYPRPASEDILKRNPDAILVMAFGGDLRPFQRMAWRWSEHPQLLAVKNKQVKVVFAEMLLRPSMRLLEGLAVLEKTLYGRN